MRLDPDRTVLIDVDTQIDFVEPDGALYVPRAETLKPSFARLLSAAKQHRIPVIASADAHGPDDPEFTVFPPHCVAGTEGQKRVAETVPERAVIVPLEGPLPAERDPHEATLVLEKVKFDLFTNPAADRAIAETGAKTAVVFGVALDYCVRAAALGLRERGYEAVVVRDATAPVTPEGGASAEKELLEAGVRFATTADVLAALG